MEELVIAAIKRGKELYNEDLKVKEFQKSIKELKEKEIKLTAAGKWITEELPEKITNKIRENPSTKHIVLDTVLAPKNKLLTPDILAEACISLGLKIVVEKVKEQYYDDGPYEEFDQFKIELMN